MRFFLRRFFTLIVTVFLVSSITFFTFNVLPGDPALSMLGVNATPERLEQLHKQLGLDKSVTQRFISWIANMLQGNPGISFRFSTPVKDLILNRLPVNIGLMLISTVIIIVVSVPLGILAAKHEGKFVDFLVSLGTQVGMSIPPFILGIILTIIFSISLKLFSVGKYVPFSENPGLFLESLILPSISIAVSKISIVVRFLRTSILEQLGSDYVRTAYSKGNKERRVLYRHVLKNALIPVITVIGMIISDILAYSLIVEQVFNLPGIGTLLISSISNRDYPLIQAIIVYIAFVVVFINFLVDVVYQIIDPRIRVK